MVFNGKVVSFTALRNFLFIIVRQYDPKEVIEMDRFVHTLNGETTETIVRTSNQAASTMKYDRIMTLNEISEALDRLMKNQAYQD